MTDRRDIALRKSSVIAKISDDDTPATPSIRVPALLLPSAQSLDPTTAAAPREEVFRHDGGIAEMVKNLCVDKIPLHPEVETITVLKEMKGVVVEVALRWSKDMYTDSLTGFANGIRTADGGSHLDGMKSAITRTINTFARKVC